MNGIEMKPDLPPFFVLPGIKYMKLHSWKEKKTITLSGKKVHFATERSSCMSEI